jgi:hypothetical protein
MYTVSGTGLCVFVIGRVAISKVRVFSGLPSRTSGALPTTSLPFTTPQKVVVLSTNTKIELRIPRGIEKFSELLLLGCGFGYLLADEAMEISVFSL